MVISFVPNNGVSGNSSGLYSSGTPSKLPFNILTKAIYSLLWA